MAYISEDFDDLYNKPFALRLVVEVLCVLSVLGSSIIIVSYFCVKDHQTRARYMLVHLSISNIGQVTTNFIGEVTNFDRFFSNRSAHHFSYTVDFHKMNIKSLEEHLCTVQAFFSIYFSLCSMLWTICLAIYLYLLLLLMKQPHFSRFLVWFGYVVCYGFPLVISAWLLFSDRLGYAPYNTPGYCGLASRKPAPDGDDDDDPVNIYGEFLGFDLWILLTVCLTLLLYLSAICYLRRSQRDQLSASVGFWKSIQNVDLKFIAIPLTFALLRIWSLAVFLMFTYFKMDPTKHQRLTWAMFFMMGIGNSIQGLTDALLFVAFTPTVRQKLLRVLLCRGEKTPKKPTLLDVESKNIYDNALKNYKPRQYGSYSSYASSSSPVHIVSTRISASPEPSTSFQESPGSLHPSIQNGEGDVYGYY